MSEALISISKCALAIGLHKSTLASQVKDGSIRSHEGKVYLSEVLEDRAKNIDLSRSARHEGRIDDGEKGVGSSQPDPTKSTVDPTLSDPTIEELDGTPVMVDGKSLPYKEARALKETYLARLRQIEYHQKSGEVVSVEAVARIITAEYGIVRNRLLGLPASVAPRLVGMDQHQISQALSEEVRLILENLSSSAEVSKAAGRA